VYGGGATTGARRQLGFAAQVLDPGPLVEGMDQLPVEETALAAFLTTRPDAMGGARYLVHVVPTVGARHEAILRYQGEEALHQRPQAG